ncbi:MAG: DUF968 domain-containing protein [Geobacter sp.]
MTANGLTYATVSDKIPGTMKPQPKQQAVRDEGYLNFIRSLPCCRCAAPSPSHAHHHPAEGNSSVGMKTSDLRTVPLCWRCHDLVHRHGKRSFWGRLDVEALISRLNIEFFLR